MEYQSTVFKQKMTQMFMHATP